MRMNLLIQPSMSPNIETLLQRSAEFELALHAEFPELELRLADSSPKLELVATAAMVSLEHGSVLRKAFEVGASNTGAALLRLQNEAVLKAAWLLFAATPVVLGRFPAAVRRPPGGATGHHVMVAGAAIAAAGAGLRGRCRPYGDTRWSARDRRSGACADRFDAAPVEHSVQPGACRRRLARAANRWQAIPGTVHRSRHARQMATN